MSHHRDVHVVGKRSWRDRRKLSNLTIFSTAFSNYMQVFPTLHCLSFKPFKKALITEPFYIAPPKRKKKQKCDCNIGYHLLQPHQGFFEIQKGGK